MSLNTVCIGLEGVAKGIVEKPKDMDITWNPADPMAVARKSRRFAIRAALVFVEEALLAYIAHLKRYSNLPDSVKKAIDKDGTAQRKDGAAKKIEKLSKCIEGQKTYWMPLVVLMVRWRNQVIHGGDTKLAPHLKKIVLEQAEDIRKNHANIDIVRTLDNFDKKVITLKDFTTMIAVTIRFVRHIDENLALKVESIEDFQGHIVDAGLGCVFKQVIGVNGSNKQRKKFELFMVSHFPSTTSAVRECFFENRFNILEPT